MFDSGEVTISSEAHPKRVLHCSCSFKHAICNVAHLRVACTAKLVGCRSAPAEAATEHTDDEREERDDRDDRDETSDTIDSGDEIVEANEGASDERRVGAGNLLYGASMEAPEVGQVSTLHLAIARFCACRIALHIDGLLGQTPLTLAAGV